MNVVDLVDTNIEGGAHGGKEGGRGEAPTYHPHKDDVAPLPSCVVDECFLHHCFWLTLPASTCSRYPRGTTTTDRIPT